MRVRPSVRMHTRIRTYITLCHVCMQRARATEKSVSRWRAGVEPAANEIFFFDDGDGRGDRHIGIQRVHNNVSCTYIYIYMIRVQHRRKGRRRRGVRRCRYILCRRRHRCRDADAAVERMHIVKAAVDASRSLLHIERE